MRAKFTLAVARPVRKMASRARLLVSSSLGTVVPERLDTRYCDPANRTRNLLACATVQEPRSESNAFDESASRGLRAVCALSQPIGKAMSAISARGRVLVPGQLGGMVVVTLVPRRHAGPPSSRSRQSRIFSAVHTKYRFRKLIYASRRYNR